MLGRRAFGTGAAVAALTFSRGRPAAAQASNKVLRESSKVVHIVLPGHDDDIARLNEIAEAYKARFKQESVGLIVRPACVAF